MSTNTYSKLFACNIHDSIRVSPMALKIIDTPEFQRLREIKQLGLCYHVYPTATHSRFEHSLGVYHLTGKILEKIQHQYPYKKYNIPELNQPKTKLTYKISECIKIAALCHDIGHGPFSHIFDNTILKNIVHENKNHEVRSCLIVELLCKRELSNELTDNHINFIKTIIHPTSQNKGAIYQIVANNLNGIDADKFDYLARDALKLGLKTGFNANRLINEFIIDKNNNIAYPKHCATDIYELFYSRYIMHKKAYCHKTVVLIDIMFRDLISKIDSIFKISDSITDMKRFCKLTDASIYQLMEYTINPLPFTTITLNNSQIAQVKKAHKIHNCITNRKLYKQIIDVTETTCSKVNLYQFLASVFESNPQISKEDLIIHKTSFGFVNENKPDPFDSIYYYDKKENNKTFIIPKNSICGLLNNNVYEIHYRLICKKKSIYQTILTSFKIFIAKSLHGSNQDTVKDTVQDPT